MKESIWGWWIMVLGIIIIGVIIFITDITTTSEQDYYMIKEISETAMMESVDYGYYSTTGKFRIISEKYMENFIRRFSEIISINKTVDINFYDIYEDPPKVTVEVNTSATKFVYQENNMATAISNRLNAILELNPNIES